MTPFSRLVSEGLRRRGLTLRQLCRAASMDPSFFSKVLAGKRSPPSEEGVLRRIAAELELDAPELIVSAGRIPSEWDRLSQDPELFRRVHTVATGAAPRPAAARTAAVRPVQTKAAEPTRLPAPAALAEELL